jgi:hypothetical protein
LFRRYFYTDFDNKLRILRISWSKNLFQKSRKDRTIRYSEIISINEPIEIGFYPNKLIVQIKNNSDFKIFNPVFSIKDEYVKFKYDLILINSNYS